MSLIKEQTYQKVAVPTEVNKYREKGFVFIFPPRNTTTGHYTYVYRKELKLFAWFLAQSLYYLHLLNILPSGESTYVSLTININKFIRKLIDKLLLLKQPPWNFQYFHRIPLKNDFIIEPDWNSDHIQ